MSNKPNFIVKRVLLIITTLSILLVPNIGFGLCPDYENCLGNVPKLFTESYCKRKMACPSTADTGSPSSSNKPATKVVESPNGVQTKTEPTSARTGARESQIAQGSEAANAATDARAKRAQLEKTMINVEKIRQQSLIDAQQQIRVHAQAALKKSGASGSISREQSAVIHDAAVVDNVATKYQNEKPITLSDANEAVFPEVRADLQDVYYSQRFEEKLSADRSRLIDTISSLLNLKFQALDRAQGMESATGNNLGLLRNKISASGLKQGSNLAEANSQVETVSANSDGPTAIQTEDSEGANKMLLAVANMKSISVPTLRDRMKRKLALARTAEEARIAELSSASGKNIFEGGLSAAATSASDSNKGAGSSLAAQAVSSALLSSSTEQQRFTLAGAETDAAVQKLMRNPSGTELASNDASVQAADSLSLFERVRAAHSHCLKQHCVQAN